MRFLNSLSSLRDTHAQKSIKLVIIMFIVRNWSMGIVYDYSDVIRNYQILTIWYRIGWNRSIRIWLRDEYGFKLNLVILCHSFAYIPVGDSEAKYWAFNGSTLEIRWRFASWLDRNVWSWIYTYPEVVISPSSSFFMEKSTVAALSSKYWSSSLQWICYVLSSGGNSNLAPGWKDHERNSRLYSIC